MALIGKAIAFARTAPGDVGVSLVHLNDDDKRAGESEAAFVARFTAKCVPAGTPSAVILSATLPSDRHFRNAWRLVSDSVVIDMNEARAIHRRNIRIARDAAIAAAEDGGSPLPIVEDVSAAIAAALTPLALKAAWPAQLPSPYT